MRLKCLKFNVRLFALLTLPILCVLLTVFAVDAAAAGLPEIKPDVNGAYTVTHSGLTDGEQVVLLVVKDKALGVGGAFPAELGESDVTYVDQATVAGGAVTFGAFIPKQLPDSTVFVTADSLSVPLAIGHITGFGVAGKIAIQSYDPKKPITVTLYEAGKAKKVDVFTFDAAASGAGQQTFAFEFENIIDGDYDLVVSKPGHVDFKITNLKVEGADVDLTQHSKAEIRTITLAVGDMNGNKSVNIQDLNVILANFLKSAGASTNANADIDGNGSINIQDLSILIAPANFQKSQIIVQYGG
jgi:hypothetical protein